MPKKTPTPTDLDIALAGMAEALRYVTPPGVSKGPGRSVDKRQTAARGLFTILQKALAGTGHEPVFLSVPGSYLKEAFESSRCAIERLEGYVTLASIWVNQDDEAGRYDLCYVATVAVPAMALVDSPKLLRGLAHHGLRPLEWDELPNVQGTFVDRIGKVWQNRDDPAYYMAFRLYPDQKSPLPVYARPQTVAVRVPEEIAKAIGVKQ